MIENRARILEAARRVYSTFGWRGATTRRIAEAAGVNEVTIFRQFGNKEALLGAVMADSAANNVLPPFPLVPVYPEAELTQWAVAHHEKLFNMREMIRQMMGQIGERPEVASCAAVGPSSAASLLQEYLQRLQTHGWLESDGTKEHAGDLASAIPMFMGTLFSDAMGRDFLHDMYPTAPEDSVASYVRLFLRAIGTRNSPQHTAEDNAGAVAGGNSVDGLR